MTKAKTTAQLQDELRKRRKDEGLVEFERRVTPAQKHHLNGFLESLRKDENDGKSTVRYKRYVTPEEHEQMVRCLEKLRSFEKLCEIIVGGG